MKNPPPQPTQPEPSASWTYNRYRATLALDGVIFAIVTPDGSSALCLDDEACLLGALNTATARAVAETATTELEAVKKELTATKHNLAVLEEWKTSVLGRLKAIPAWHTLNCGGIKEGWGFCFEFIGWMQRRSETHETALASVRAELAEERRGKEALLIEAEKLSAVREYLAGKREMLDRYGPNCRFEGVGQINASTIEELEALATPTPAVSGGRKE